MSSLATLDDLGTSHLEALGWRWGYGCFETFVWDEGGTVGLAWHVERLVHGCRQLEMAPSFPIEELPHRILAVLNGYTGGPFRIRVEAVLDDPGFVSGGKPPFAMRLGARIERWTQPDPRRSFMAKILEEIPPGLEVATPGYKPLNYAVRMALRNELQRRGVQEGILSLDDTRAVGGLTTNLFVTYDGEAWLTPKLSTGALPGVTRHVLMTELDDLNRAIADLPIADLAETQAAFVTNSVLGVQPITRFFLGAKRWKDLDPEPAFAVRELYEEFRRG